MKKTYILDTNVLLSDTHALHSFEENDIIIPMVVLEELDNQKNRQDEVGAAARFTSRQLDSFREQGNLNDGITLPTGGILRVMPTETDIINQLPAELRLAPKADNAIIAFAYEMTKKGTECVLVSKDVNVRVKCDALKIKSEDYLKMRVADDREHMYRGVSRIHMSGELIDEFYKGKDVVLPEETLNAEKLYPNQILVIKNVEETQSAIARFISPTEQIHHLVEWKDVFGLKPRNKEQQFAFDLLMDDSVKLVTLTGNAGCGKTLLALAAGMQQVIGEPKYDRLIVSRPVQPMGRDIGYLPGTIEEKMEPWIAPVKDNLNFLLGNSKKRVISKKDKEQDKEFKQDPILDMWIEQGKIEVEALTYIRGRSIPNSFILIDEAQNLSIHELKTIITRVGENTKVVVTGDLEQIDNVHVDIFTNGLTYAVEKFKEYAIAGHITLLKGERSELATLASKVL